MSYTEESNNTGEVNFGLPDIWKRGLFWGILTALTVSTVYLYRDSEQKSAELIQAYKECNELERRARLEKDSLQQKHYLVLMEQKKELQDLFTEQIKTERVIKKISNSNNGKYEN